MTLDEIKDIVYGELAPLYDKLFQNEIEGLAQRIAEAVMNRIIKED